MICTRISTARGTRRASPRSGACRRGPFSIITRTSPLSSPSTDWQGRCWAWPSTAWAWAATAARGVASCFASTARAANGWADCDRCACPAAIARRASRGAWVRLRCRSRAATTRSTRRYADEPAAPAVRDMLARPFNAPETSSMGRWFDAAAGLLEVKRRMAFEGQAAMLLEGVAERYGAVPADASLYAIGARQRTRPHAAA